MSKCKILCDFHASSLLSANSNSNETPCGNDSTNNNIQHLSSQWGVSSSQLNRNASPTGQTLPTTLSQLGQPLGVHSQSLAGFGQNGLHNSSLHGYSAHNASKGFGHQPFYGWYWWNSRVIDDAKQFRDGKHAWKCCFSYKWSQLERSLRIRSWYVSNNSRCFKSIWSPGTINRSFCGFQGTIFV